MKSIQIILNAILSKDVFEYLLIDREMRITFISFGMTNFLDAPASPGDDIRDHLPELVGAEEDIAKIFDAPGSSMSIKTIHKEKLYCNIYIDYYDKEQALLLMQNITEVSQAQQRALQHSNETLLLNDTLQKIIDRQNALIFVTDNKDKIVFSNQTFLRYFNPGEGEIIFKRDIGLCKKISKELDTYEAFQNYLLANDVKYITIKHDTFIVEVSRIDAAHYLFALSKVTDIYQKKKDLEIEVAHDALTGAMKKKYFDQRLQQYLSEPCSLVLVVVDIDDFKGINDTYGHPVGDSVLKEFAALLQKCIRNGDMIARWGGEEFLLAIKIDRPETALERVEAIRKRVEKHQFGTIKHLTASFGLAWREEGDDIDTLLQRADKALYKAKENGKNRVILKKKEKLEK